MEATQKRVEMVNPTLSVGLKSERENPWEIYGKLAPLPPIVKPASMSSQEGAKGKVAPKVVVSLTSETLRPQEDLGSKVPRKAAKLCLEALRSRVPLYEDHKLYQVDPSLLKLYLSNYGIRKPPNKTVDNGSVVPERKSKGKGGPIRVSTEDIWLQRNLVSPGAIARFENLKVLGLNRCVLNELPPLGKHLANLRLEMCTAGSFTPMNERQVGEGFWEFKQLGSLRAITLKDCVCPLVFAPTDTATARLEILTIANHNTGTRREPMRLSDRSFASFPSSLVQVSLEGSNVTDRTVSKLPKTLRQLTLEECLFVPTHAQLSHAFPDCLVEGVQRRDHRRVSLQRRLEGRVLGQSEAIRAVVSRLHWPGEKEFSKRPIVCCFEASMNSLAKSLADTTGRPFVRYGMKGMPRKGDNRAVTRLFGNGKGDGQLIDICVRIPDAVIVLDEMEHAPFEIWKFFAWKFLEPKVETLTQKAQKARQERGTSFYFPKTGDTIKASLANSIIIMTFSLEKNKGTQRGRTPWEALLEDTRTRLVNKLSPPQLENLKRHLIAPISFDEPLTTLLALNTRLLDAHVRQLSARFGLNIHWSTRERRSLVKADIESLMQQLSLEITKAIRESTFKYGDEIKVSIGKEGKSLAYEKISTK